jgi:hypothetical protein
MTRMNLSPAYDLSKAKSRLGRAGISRRWEMYDGIVSCILTVFGEETNIFVRIDMGGTSCHSFW